MKELLQSQQPIVYQALKNALQKDRLANAYLFVGPFGTPKKETAIFLAQSILCGKQDYACESCEVCNRVRDGLHGDVIVLDGNEKTIGKDAVDAIQEQFSKTALEQGTGKKVYILLNAEYATGAAMNSLLKFLEEPANDVIAILTTDNVNRILPTVVSRCTIMPFLPVPRSQFMKEAEKIGVNEEDIYFVSNIAGSMEDIDQIYESDAYETALSMFRQFLNIDGHREELAVVYDYEYRKKERNENSKTLRMFFDFLMLYAKDALKHDDNGPSWYHEAVEKAHINKEKNIRLFQIASEQKDKCNRYNDLNLVFYQAMYRMEENNL